jgi:hypothetical protein
MDIYGNPIVGAGGGSDLDNGGTIGGPLLVTGTLQVEGKSTFNDDVVINGDLDVQGTITSIDELEVKDPLITLAVDNPSDLLNTGVLHERDGGTYGGLVRQAGGGFRLFETQTPKPTPTGTILRNGELELKTVDAENVQIGTTLLRDNGGNLDVTNVGDVRLSSSANRIVLAAEDMVLNSQLITTINSFVRTELTGGEVLIDPTTIRINNASDQYILPNTRGAAGHVMTDDGAGNLSFQPTGNPFDQSLNTDDEPSFRGVTITDENNGALIMERVNDTRRAVVEFSTGGNPRWITGTFGSAAITDDLSYLSIVSGLAMRIVEASGRLAIGAVGTEYFMPRGRGTAGQVLVQGASGDVTWSSALSGGDVVGPGASTDRHVALFDGTSGKLLQDSPVEVQNTGQVITTGANPFFIMDNTLTQWQFRHNGALSLVNIPLAPDPAETVWSTLSNRFNINRDTSIEGWLEVNEGLANRWRLAETRGTAGQVLTSNGDGTSTWANVVSEQDVFTFNFGGSASSQAQRFLLFGGTSNVGTTAGIDIQSVTYMVKNTYLVALSVVRQNLSSTTQFILSRETSPGSGIFTDTTVLTIPPGSQVDKILLTPPLLMAEDTRVCMSVIGAGANPQNCSAVMYCSFLNQALPP